jgi:hypothetical protein
LDPALGAQLSILEMTLSRSDAVAASSRSAGQLKQNKSTKIKIIKNNKNKTTKRKQLN